MAISTTTPLVYVDDDEDDQFLFQAAIKDLAIGHPIRSFTSSSQALAYLVSTPERPLLILSDMNMPVMSGLELHRQILADTKLKGWFVPFIYLTTGVSPDQLEQAHQLGVQGFHLKAQDFEALKAQLSLIVGYWQASLGHRAQLA